MKIIKTTKGHEVMVDDEDFARPSKMTWYLGNRGYVVCDYRGRGMREHLQLHREVMGLQKGDSRLVDHRNGDALDNQKANLRICTKAQNGWNQGPQKTNTTGYKGVSKTPNGRYTCQIRHLGRKYHLGSYPAAEEAYEVYCLAADLLHGEFANHGDAARTGASS